MRDGPQCGNITVEQLTAMPALLHDLEVHANSTWGPDWYGYGVNISSEDNLAQACYPSSMEFSPNFNLKCSNSSVMIKANVTVPEVEVTVGHVVNVSTTVETSTELLSSTQFTPDITVSFPPFNEKETLPVSLTNTEGLHNQSITDMTGHWKLAFCLLSTTEVTTCTGQSNINIQMTLNGHVAFYYPRKAGESEDPQRPIYLPTALLSAKAKSELTLSLALSVTTKSYGSVYSHPGTQCTTPYWPRG